MFRILRRLTRSCLTKKPEKCYNTEMQTNKKDLPKDLKETIQNLNKKLDKFDEIANKISELKSLHELNKKLSD